MKIAVVGAGVIGSVVGGLLARAGEDVVLVGRKSHVDAIQEDGLAIEGVLGTLNVPVKATEGLTFQPDLALLAVKTQDVEDAVREARRHLSGVPVVTMQNGVRSDSLVASVLGRDKVISAVVFLGSTYLEPGRVRYFMRGSLLIGEPFGSAGGRAGEIAGLLNKAAPTRLTGNIAGAHWTKLIMNLNNALPALTGLSVQEVNRHAAIRRLCIRLMCEGMKVAKAAGITPGAIPGFPVGL